MMGYRLDKRLSQNDRILQLRWIASIDPLNSGVRRGIRGAIPEGDE